MTIKINSVLVCYYNIFFLLDTVEHTGDDHDRNTTMYGCVDSLWNNQLDFLPDGCSYLNYDSVYTKSK